LSKLVKVVKPIEEIGGVVTGNEIDVDSKPTQYVLSKMDEPVTIDDLWYWKSRQARVPLNEELMLRLLFEIRDKLKGLHKKLDDIHTSVRYYNER
jgi:hypothetical protein